MKYINPLARVAVGYALMILFCSFALFFGAKLYAQEPWDAPMYLVEQKMRGDQ